MHSDLMRQNVGMKLHEWQRNVGWAFLLELNCTVIAGKAIPIILSLAAPPGKKRAVLLFSLLKLLQVQQASPFLGLSLG
jgi:hypothetical protein